MLSNERNGLAGNIAGDLHIGIQGPPGPQGDSTTITLKYGVSSTPSMNTVTGWQDTIPQMSETYPYLWIEITTETKTATGGSSTIEAGIIGYYSTPGSGGNANQGGGMSTTAANLLITILRNGVYSTDQSDNITALATALGVTEEEQPDTPVKPDEPDNPEIVTYTITNNLTNVTNSNSASKVEQGGSYSATLTAADGYELDSVTVTMGGVDVTSTVYLDGAISIATVSGDIVITATAKGLPVNVPMSSRYNDRHSTIIYADDGTEKLEEGTCTMVLSEDVFTEDTEVTVTIETNSAMYSKMYGACYLQGIDIDTALAEKPLYHAELLFNAWTDVGKAGTYTKTYTVKAGYGLAIVNEAATVAPVTSVTVTA